LTELFFLGRIGSKIGNERKKMGRNREAILKVLEEHRDAAHGYGVRRLGLFGSCDRGECSETSDLDFVVEFETKSFDAYMDLKAFLEELFECPIDLVISDTIKPRLRATILGEAIHAPGL
jgi:predicted nucleotidyltransferase